MALSRSPVRHSTKSAMPSLHLSVAPPMIRVVRLIQWTLSGIICVAITVAGWWWWDSRTLEEEAVRYELAATRTEDLTRQFTAQMQRDQLTLTAQQIAAIKQDVAFINQLAEKRQFSWTQLLADLEEALPPGTSIGTIQVDFKDATVKIDGTAVRMQDLNALITSLQKRPSFTDARLHHHRLIDAKVPRGKGDDAGVGDGPSPVGLEFSLTVTYRRTT